MIDLLCYRAGPAALAHVRKHGLDGQVRVLVAPATGPKWLAAYGLDRALIERGMLAGGGRALLAGASAGAWRSLCFASPEPERKHAQLMRAYCAQVFERSDTPASVLAAFERMLRELFEGQERALLEGPHDLAIHTARARGSGPRSPHPSWHLASLLAAGLLAPLAPGAQALALERVTVHTPGAAAWLSRHRARRATLTATNVLPAALASAAVPLSMEPVRDVLGAPAGSYLDGGLTDYHLAEAYTHDPGVTLLVSHQPRIVARWLDQRLPWRRRPPARALDRLVHVYPHRDFVDRLPGGRVPDRRDFVELADRPQERIRRWREVVYASEDLGSQLLQDLASGRVPDVLRPFDETDQSRA